MEVASAKVLRQHGIIFVSFEPNWSFGSSEPVMLLLPVILLDFVCG